MAVDFLKKENIKKDSDLMIGAECREFLRTTTISTHSRETFFTAVKDFYKNSYKYLRTKLPTTEVPVMQKASVADISLRKVETFESVEFFVKRSPILLQPGKYER